LTGGRGEKTVRCLVAGRVQGVFFRAATAEQARRLGLSGWAKNLADGRVEVVAAGPADAVAELAEWLWTGPPAADVASVSVEEWHASVGGGFSTH
jgi:acylphosphatase